MHTARELHDALPDLRRAVTGDVRDDAMSRILYSTDASIYQVEPLAVLIPRSIGDVASAVAWCARYGVPILPRGSGTSLAGQAVNTALVVDTTRHLDRVLEIRPEERWVRAEPGVILGDLNRVLRPHGLQFGPDPASADRATLGGVVSNNATGSHAILYGMTADHVLEVDAVLADGREARFGPLDPGGLAERRRRPGLEGAVYDAVARLVADPRHRATIAHGTPRHWRRAGGYNLDRLVAGSSRWVGGGSRLIGGGSPPAGPAIAFHHAPDPRFSLAPLLCGAEGTLGAITSVKLNLVPVPAATGLALVTFATRRAALEAVPAILETGPAAVELLDRVGLTLCRDVPFYARLMASFLGDPTDDVLVVEYRGESPAAVAAAVADLARRLDRGGHGATSVVPILEPRRQDAVWTVRKAGLGLVMSIKGDRKPLPFIEDAAVPVERLADYIARIDAFLGDLGTTATYYAHAGSGCLHVRPFVDAKLARDVARLPEIAGFSAELVRGCGGALSSEHGDGRSRSWLGPAFFGPDLYRLFEQVKTAFDPDNLFNPGNIVGAPPMTEHLRYGETYAAQLPATRLDYAPDLGFDRAVELCNGAGVCRKTDGGTMCPSFMATREEADSTRGRANALRAVLDGRLPATELAGDRLQAVMDLCVGCKACKAECPSAVDMAKLKVEVLAARHAAHGIAARDRLFADIARLGRLASGPSARLARALDVPPARRLLDRSLGIARLRPLPVPARQPFYAWFHARHRRRSTVVSAAPPAVTGVGNAGDLGATPDDAPGVRQDGTVRRPVVLFHDTFNTYFTPEVAIAATHVLEAAGYIVRLSAHGCCGRPMLSRGLVDAARAAARATVHRLAPAVARGWPIVGLEPSCVSMLRDDYRSLLPDDPRVRALSDAARTFEELVAEAADRGTLRPAFDDRPRRLLVHGHCHQKVISGMAPSRRALGLAPGHVVEEIDAGCCGMAGSFGYESEHYAVSMAMAERKLLPAVRSAAPDTLVVAAGTSCREQIRHGTGRRAWHPAEVLWEALLGRGRCEPADGDVDGGAPMR